MHCSGTWIYPEPYNCMYMFIHVTQNVFLDYKLGDMSCLVPNS